MAVRETRRALRVIVGLAADTRCLGLAVVIHDVPGACFARRHRVNATQDLESAQGWVLEKSAAYQPDLVVFAEGSSSELLVPCAERLAATCAIPSFSVTDAEIATLAGLDAFGYAALRRFMRDWSSLARQLVRPTRGDRSPAERHWNAAVVALAAAEVARRTLAEKSGATQPGSGPVSSIPFL